MLKTWDKLTILSGVNTKIYKHAVIISKQFLITCELLPQELKDN